MALDAAGGSLSAGVPGVAGSFVPTAAADGAATGLAGAAENVAAVAGTAADNAVANGIIEAGEQAGAEGVVNAAPLAAESTGALPEGSFSIRDWSGYPQATPGGAAMPQPGGPFRLLTGSEQQVARATTNTINAEIRDELPLWTSSGLQWHEIQPVKFGGSPTDLANKIPLPADFHQQVVTPWWNSLQRALEKGG